MLAEGVLATSLFFLTGSLQMDPVAKSKVETKKKFHFKDDIIILPGPLPMLLIVTFFKSLWCPENPLSVTLPGVSYPCSSTKRCDSFYRPLHHCSIDIGVPGRRNHNTRSGTTGPTQVKCGLGSRIGKQKSFISIFNYAIGLL